MEAFINNYCMKFFVISGIINFKASVTETVIIISEVTNTKSNNYLIIHCFEENNDKHTVVRKIV